MTKGTILITGANGFLAIPSAEYLLTNYPEYTALLAVRNPDDENSKRLRKVISHFPETQSTIRTLDLGSLASVDSFAANIKSEIKDGKLPPLAGVKFSPDGYERSFAVNQIGHFALILKLLGSFGPDGGKIVFLGTNEHDPARKGSFATMDACMPEDLNLFIKPPFDKKGKEAGGGLYRYGVSKCAAVMTMYGLNRRLSQDPTLNKITAMTVDPGGPFPDPRCMDHDVPMLWRVLMYGLLNPLYPVFKHVMFGLRKTSEAAVDLIEMSVGSDYRSATGYYLMRKKMESSTESRDEGLQRYGERASNGRRSPKIKLLSSLLLIK